MHGSFYNADSCIIQINMLYNQYALHKTINIYIIQACDSSTETWISAFCELDLAVSVIGPDPNRFL